MARRIAATLVVVAVIVAGTPWLFGLQTKGVYNAARDDLAARGYRITEDRYRLGWLGSDALLEVGPPGAEPAFSEVAPGVDASEPPADGAAPRLRISTRISHGPLTRGINLAALRSRLRVVGGVRQLPPLLIDGRIGLDRSLALDARMPNISYAGRDRQLRLSGIAAEIMLDAPSAPLLVDGHLDQLVLGAVDGTAVSIEALYWRLRLERIPELMLLPAGEIGLEHLWLRSAAVGGQSLELGQVAIDLSAEQAAERLDLAVAFDAGTIGWQRLSAGPARIGIRLSGVDLQAARELRRALDALQTQPVAPSVRGVMQVRLLETGLPALFDEDARLRLDPVELAGREGPISATLALSLGSAASAGEPWFQRLIGDARLDLPQPLLLELLAQQQRDRVVVELRRRGEPAEPLPPELDDQVAEVAQIALARLIRERWLVPRQGRLLAELRLGDGLLSVNGQRIPLDPD